MQSRVKKQNTRFRIWNVCGLILVLGIFSFIQNHYDTYWKKAQSLLVLEVNGCETQTPEEQLLVRLEKAVDSYINLGQVIKTAPCYSTEDALDEVLQHDAELTAAAEKYGIEKSMLQAVLFQEIRFYGVEDPVADAWVEASYAYENHHTEGMRGSVENMPVLTHLCRQDSSTGIAQIYAKTAIEAYNWNYGMSYDSADPAMLEQFWRNLQDDTYCIDMEAMVLRKIMADQQVEMPLTQNETEKVMARYNGTNSWAQKYGEVTLAYYAAFQEYNEID